MKTPVFIRVFQGDQLIEVKQFTQDQIVFGQDQSAIFKLNDPMVAPIHAMIERRGDDYVITDLGSATGTFVNGNKVVEHKLNSGDEIRLGSLRLEFFVGIPKAGNDSKVANIASVKNNGFTDNKPVENKTVFNPRPQGAPSNKLNIEAGSGPDVQVVVAWHNHVLSTNRFEKQARITMGASHSCDVLLPLLAGGSEQVLLTHAGSWTVAPLSQSVSPGEVLRLDFENDVCVYVSLANSTGKPVMAPFLNFTTSELTAFVVSLVFVGMAALYMGLYTPPDKLDDDSLENLARVAIVINQPIKQMKPQPQPIKTENPVVKEEKPAAKAQTNADEGKISEVRPKKLDVKRPKTLTSVKQGGAIKTGPKDGANAQSEKKDIAKEGLLATFGSKGAQKQLDQAYGGTGELQGLANQANGSAGSSTDRPGDNLGSQFKDTGAGGKGTATQGIAGVGRGGNGFGNKGYGTGGLGDKTGTLVIPGGQGEEFVGSIDRDAIRRVVQSHLREVQFCYEQALVGDQSASGRVVIGWEIGAGGTVVTAHVKNAPNNLKGVAECIVTRLRAWTFPEPPGGNTPQVSYPFVLERK